MKQRSNSGVFDGLPVAIGCATVYGILWRLRLAFWAAAHDQLRDGVAESSTDPYMAGRSTSDCRA
jgi:hypothetical protein